MKQRTNHRNLAALAQTALAVTAMLVTSCSSNDDNLLQSSAQQQVQTNEPQALSFDVYTSRSTDVNTRAGIVGEATTASISGTGALASTGFGVFGYYTDNDYYARETKPNFLYNQKVTKGDGASAVWTYSPVVYWPNEYGSTASSADKDKVSFFAYLPWVDVDPSTGWIKAGAEAYQRGTGDANMNYGITGVSRNTITGDPYVRYLSSFDTGKQVDLCWGVQGTSDSGTLNWATLNDATGQKIDNGLPWLNVLRPATIANGKVKFDFRHATSKLIMNIVAGDKFTNYSTSAAANKTRIYVRSVTLHGIAQQGVLNLNNTKPGQPLWMANNASEWFTPGQSVTITDGRADGLEATTPATNESNVFLNPVIIQNNAWPTANWSAAANQGVGRTAVSLFSKNGGVDATTASYVYVIPTNEKFQVSIVYDVETVVPDLPGYVSDGTTHGTSIENKITQTVKVGTADLILEAGKFYTINLTLGMNEVQFDATVTAWPSTTSGSANLPTPGA